LAIEEEFVFWKSLWLANCYFACHRACNVVAFCAQNSADYIQLYSGDKETLVSSLECIQRTSAEILAAIAPSE
jgi:hypothetical protein